MDGLGVATQNFKILKTYWVIAVATKGDTIFLSFILVSGALLEFVSRNLQRIANNRELEALNRGALETLKMMSLIKEKIFGTIEFC